MSWTNPKTWVAGNALTAAELNTHVRDNFNASIPVTSTITTTGTQTALAIPDGRGHLIIFANNASLLTIQGITAAQDGQILTIYSVGAGQVDIANQNGSASAANRIINSVTGTISLAAGAGRAVMVYNGTNSRWRVIEHEQGAWITRTFAAGNYTGSGAMTVTMASGDVTTDAYYLRSRVLHIMIELGTFTTGGTPDTEVRVAVPGGFTVAKSTRSAAVVQNNGGGFDEGWLVVTAAGTTIAGYRANNFTTTWANGTDNNDLRGQIFFEVQ
jgi:hypothetical protein